uniref:Carcinoembryonic antigen-related cell adhesion molecule 19 like gene M n=1 Tax=Xenopus tropicalis TaxID=8364 RepID=A0A6I8SB02_XENTR
IFKTLCQRQLSLVTVNTLELLIKMLLSWKREKTALVVYPVVNQSVTLRVTGVTGTIRQFTWYKGSSTDSNNQIFSVIPSANSVTKGPQYLPRASWFPNGSLQISGLVPTDQGNYTVQIQTENLTQVTVLLRVNGDFLVSYTHGFGVQLIPQYPVVNQSVTLRVTGVAGTILQFWWYKGSSVDTNSQIFSVIPFPNSMTPGPQYFHRASQFPNGSLQISSLIPTDQGNFALMMLTAQGLAKVYIYLPVHGKYSSLCNSFIIIIRSPSWFI